MTWNIFLINKYNLIFTCLILFVFLIILNLYSNNLFRELELESQRIGVIETEYWESKRVLEELRGSVSIAQRDYARVQLETQKFTKESIMWEKENGNLENIVLFMKDYLGWPNVLRSWEVWEKNNYHCYPISQESPFPKLSSENREPFHVFPKSLPGINAQNSTMLELMKKCSKYNSEIKEYPKDSEDADPGTYYWDNNMFGLMDANIYHCMIRLNKPKKIIEVGSGWSTLVAINAAKKNVEESRKNHNINIVCVEPYPLRGDLLTQESISVIQDFVQNVDIQVLTDLEENDILFIDSSHVFHFSSDVRYLFLDVLPRLKKGVFVHIHDIYLPSDIYPESYIFEQHRYYNEDYFLRAFLLFNDHFQILWSGTYTCRFLKENITSILENDHCHTGFWMRKIL